METVMPSPPVDFNFDSACTTPYISAPSSPQHFGAKFSSVPASPTRFHDVVTVPFSWEEKPGVPKSKRDDAGEYINVEDDFVFEFSGPLEKAYLSAADDLFDSGKIKPLKPSLQLSYSHEYPDKTVKEVRRRSGAENDPSQRRRGRETRSNNPRHKATRSLSPFRASDLVFDQKQTTGQENTNNNNNSVSSSFISIMLSGRWKLKDLLLFRSASEGHASSKKYAAVKSGKKKSQEADVYCSFRSTDNNGEGSISRRRRRGPVSAHEIHYTINRTISEELRRKTFLPYKQGLLGCLGFNPAVHEMSCRGFA